MAEHIHWHVAPVLGEGSLHENENGVVGADLYIVETAPAHAVDVQAEKPLRIVGELYGAYVYPLVMAVVYGEPVRRGRVKREDLSHTEGIGGKDRLVGRGGCKAILNARRESQGA